MSETNKQTNQPNPRSGDAYKCTMRVFYSTTDAGNLDWWTGIMENMSAIRTNLTGTCNITGIFLVIGWGALYDENKHQLSERSASGWFRSSS